jgi:asparagine synthase (glutamine-hydrolysing)
MNGVIGKRRPCRRLRRRFHRGKARLELIMPGITGIISAHPGRACLDTVRSMVAVMQHESFYRSGCTQQASACVAAGWAVHPNSFADGNPFWNETGDVCVVFSGEVFSDHAVDLLTAYAQAGPAFIDDLNGSFCGVLIDLHRDVAILFNDRHGLGRLYLHECAEAVYFGSEAKSLLRVLPATRQLDAVALAEFAACGCALEDRTLFAGVSLLPPASRWTFRRGQLVKKETYFDVKTWEQLPALSEADYYEQLKSTFPQAVKKQFKGAGSAQANVGMSLTGGLDGRMIMACSGQDPGALPCYTFGGSYRDCSDVSLARQMARDCEQTHQVITVDEPFLQQFASLAEKAVYVSDGAMDVTGAVELFANAQARQIAPVRMTGNYGSEILRHNLAFKAQPLDAQLFNADFLRLGDVAAANYAHATQGRRLSAITMKQVPWFHHARLSLEQSQLTMRSPYLDNDVVRLAYQSPLGQLYSKAPALRFVADTKPSLSKIPTDRGLLHRPTPALTQLNHYFQEFTFKAEYAYDYGMPQWLAPVDKALKAWHPERLFLGRHKFYHFRVWYRDRLSAYLKEVLLDPQASQRPHLRPGSLKRLLTEHLSGVRNHTSALHQALSIELMYRQLIERRW